MSDLPDNDHSSRRVTLPPIRDFFREEFTRSHSTIQETPSTTLARLRMDEEPNPIRPLSPASNPPRTRIYRSTSEQLPRPSHQPTFNRDRPGPNTPDTQDHYLPTVSSSTSTLPSHTPISQHHPAPTHRQYDYLESYSQPNPSPRSPNRQQIWSLNTSNQTLYRSQSSGTFVESRTGEAIHGNLVQMPRLPAPPNPADSARVHDIDSPPALVRAVAPWVIATNLDVGQIYEDDERTPIARPFDIEPMGRSSSHVVPLGRFLDEGSQPPLGKYDCKFCGKLFNRPSSLRIHLNSHTGEKPFVCPHPDCGRSFSVLSNMRRHARVHMSNPKEQEPEESTDETSTQSSPTAPSTPRLSTVAQGAAPIQVQTQSLTHYRRDSDASASSSSSRRSRDNSNNGQMKEVERPEKRSRHRPT